MIAIPSENYEEVLYSFPPIVGSKSCILMLGTMPGITSLATKQYYAHPQNQFWKIMEDLYGAALSLSYAKRLDIIKSKNIAVWDVVQSCERNDDVIAASVLATAIRTFVEQNTKDWEGTATSLLNELRTLVDDNIARDKKLWPQTNRILSDRMLRVSPALRRVGIEIERRNGKNHQRLIKLVRTNAGPDAPPPAPPKPPNKFTKRGGANALEDNKGAEGAKGVDKT